MKPLRPLVTTLVLLATLLASLGSPTGRAALAAPRSAPAAESAAAVAAAGGKELWRRVPASTPPARQGAKPALKARRYGSFALNRGGMVALLATAPRERGNGRNAQLLDLSLPNPRGVFERFAVEEAPVMEPGLAALHPEIKTYRGRGIDDPAATIRFDLTPLGFHASVRSPKGGWYIEPYYHLDDSLYASYFGRDLENQNGNFVERESGEPEIAVDRGNYYASATVQLAGGGFAPNAPVTITISDPEGRFATRTVSAKADADGAVEASFAADPAGVLGTHAVEANDGSQSAYVTYEVVLEDDLSADPPTGDILRTYRLALLTDPGYANYFGADKVTAAKVTLINRVTQVYEDETSIRLVLIADNDRLNLNTAAQMTGANGPCGGSACYTQTQATNCTSSTLTRTRQVIGLLVGASSFDIGHIALGQPGGGVASLGVVGGNNKAQGCTGLPAPVGDYFAVDYVAHEIGHQFAGNHTFNGNQVNCSGGNRSAATSVEPGSGSSIMAYAGICGTDNLQPHSDPYWSQRSFDEVTTYITGAELNINEVQLGVLTGFDANGKSFQLRFNGNDSAPIVRGTNYTTLGVQAAIQAIAGWPAGGTAVVSALSDTAFTVTFGGTLAGSNVAELQLVNCAGCTGFVGEVAKGGATTRRGNITPTGQNIPTVTAPIQFTIPVRTPFALTGSGSDADGDTLTYMWEQNDRGATAGTSLISNVKTNGPLFRQFGTAANVSASDTLLYNSPGLNAVSTNPTRVFPDLEQILANNTNAETGSCPAASSPPTAVQIDCFSEFLPTAAYVGFTNVNASPLSLNFRLAVRDGRGGVNAAVTRLLLAPTAGPFLVTSPNTAATYKGGSTQTITWDVAGTAAAPVNAANVKISLSTDGGYTYPTVLAASTPNDGSEAVTLPNVGTTQARVKIEAVGNVFFDLSNANFTIEALPVVTSSLGENGARSVQYSDPLAPDVTVSVSDADSLSSALNVSIVGLPTGLTLSPVSTSDGQTLPGGIIWKLAGAATAAPGSYPVTVTVTDSTGGVGTTSFTITVAKEDARATYSGGTLFWTSSASSTSANVTLSATIRDISAVAGDPTFDPTAGDIRNAKVTFVNRDTNTAFPGCSNLAVGLVSTGDAKTGTASCTTPLTAGSTGGSVYTVGIIVNGYYVRNDSADNNVITVAQPIASSFITGGGNLAMSKSAGLYPGTAGSNANFGFNVKYNRGGTNLQGNVNIIVRSGGRVYQIKSNVLSSLGVSGAKANFTGKANIQDITDPLNPVSVDSNATLQLWMTDNGEPGTKDTLGIQVLNKSGGIWFASNWTGTKTAEQTLGGGNLAVR